MSQPLCSSQRISQLAYQLGVPLKVNPVDGIMNFCELRISQLMVDFPDCSTPAEMLDCIAAKVGIVFEEVSSDEDLQRILKKYVGMGEMGFVMLEKELSGETFGITIKRNCRENWESLYVSIIDCRSDKAARAYYTKWHEIAHVLTLTDETCTIFRRTHSSLNAEDPEERMMDMIAARLGFHPSMTKKFMRAYDEITFGAIDELREQLCPGASRQASLINFARFWPNPCILINAAMGLKKQQEAMANQQGFFFHGGPKEDLRAVHVARNDAAREIKFVVHPQWRVPQRSVIYRVYFDDLDYAEAIENLDWWEASSGSRLDSRDVFVQARRTLDAVDALIVPIHGRRP